MVALTELIKEKIKNEMQRLLARVPEHAGKTSRLEYDIKGSQVTLFQSRADRREPENPDLRKKIAIAQFRNDKNGNWFLYWQKANGQWLLCDWMEPQTDFGKVVDEVENDSFNTFWG